MDHWFDTLTRNLGRQPLDRRTMLSWSTRLAVAAGLGLLGRNTTPAQAAPAAAAPAVASSACTVEDSYGVLKTVVTATSGDPAAPLTLTHTFISEVGSGSASASLSISPGTGGHVAPDDVVLRHWSLSHANQRSVAGTTLGRRYTGAAARGAYFETDGRTIQGAVDGRATTTIPLGTDTRGIGFKDGQPLKPLSDGAQATQAQQAVAALLAAAKTQFDTCAPDPTSSKVVSTCSSCQLTCRQTWVDCSMSAAQASLAAGALAAGAYLTAASATCDRALQTCQSTCKSSGACCPDFCKGDAACCQSAWGCCPPSGTSQKQWSNAWPICPRCGTPPWPAVAKASPPQTTPVKQGPKP
jgi:hypothetical protein